MTCCRASPAARCSTWPATPAARPSYVQFGIDELTGSAAFWTSSLSGAVPIHAVDGVALPRRDEEVATLAALLIFGGEKPVR